MQEFYENDKKALNQELDDLKKEKMELERNTHELNSVIAKLKEENVFREVLNKNLKTKHHNVLCY